MCCLPLADTISSHCLLISGVPKKKFLALLATVIGFVLLTARRHIWFELLVDHRHSKKFFSCAACCSQMQLVLCCLLIAGVPKSLFFFRCLLLVDVIGFVMLDDHRHSNFFFPIALLAAYRSNWFCALCCSRTHLVCTAC